MSYVVFDANRTSNVYHEFSMMSHRSIYSNRESQFSDAPDLDQLQEDSDDFHLVVDGKKWEGVENLQKITDLSAKLKKEVKGYQSLVSHVDKFFKTFDRIDENIKVVYTMQIKQIKYFKKGILDSVKKKQK